jgi:hypothetical protein
MQSKAQPAPQILNDPIKLPNDNSIFCLVFISVISVKRRVNFPVPNPIQDFHPDIGP